MLNVKNLSELLARNVDPNLFPHMFIMSRNGTLLAYSTPVDIKDLRDQAALVSMTWKEYGPDKQQTDTNNASSPSKDLQTLTIEFENNNIIARAIQPTLLLVLIGGVPPSRKSGFKITPEARGDPRYPPTDDSAVEDGDATQHGESQAADSLAAPTGDGAAVAAGKKRAPSITSTMSQREKDIKGGVLHIQRKKADAMADFIRKEFDAKGFVMPDDSSFP
ncbi:hypothetical protein BU24DRAFT_79492 [Aaosphaeria arxii CBS 175.79]|uniref:Roadblock/LAMTOR2 domain-containing protein n=1 Tax=Aaosphaeria arxii CBS 175.79 TaxID=1450172 RepID=A0A6A5XA23_9PLEO|nr:uncharacterized protein BU24DRAFT_79492 [Aaosphaeria arxii CBS 175.79]KAF2009614.1 hypothetical protein BU24DRAFT_79492 [Aaosphaeria arxii CBS 175.79]